jgi:hypothetical protein
MLGAIARLIQSQGREYGVYNATGTGGRTTPDYGSEPETTITGVLERRTSAGARTVTNSDGTEVETDLEIRAVPDDGVDLFPAGSAEGYPTLLEHPDGHRYRLLDIYAEDSGVTALTVVTE